MMQWLKFIWSVVVNEVRLKSKYSGLGNDTLTRCLLATAFSVGFYFFIYYFPYEKPEPRKIEWHRLVAGLMAGVGIVSAVGEYSIHLYRRIKARLHRQGLGPL
jgi:hypothetical protein